MTNNTTGSNGNNAPLSSPSPSPSSSSSVVCCVVCNEPNIDLRSTGCPCAFHAKCALPLLLKDVSSSSPEQHTSACCQFCHTPGGAGCSGSGFRLEPLAFDELEKAVDLRTKQEAKTADNHDMDSAAAKIRAAVAVYFPQGGKGDDSSLRTGRWTKEEVAYMDHLERSFDEGDLPIPTGSKLSTFLGDILLCRSSRLTKKRKRAKLSIRSFELNAKNAASEQQQKEAQDNNKMLFQLQEKFLSILSSTSSSSAKMELRFNISKQWRTYVSELCVQIGYSKLDVQSWIASLEELEERVATAEEQQRSLQRRHLRHGTTTTSTVSPAATTTPTTAAVATRNTMVSPTSSCAASLSSEDDNTTTTAGDEHIEDDQSSLHLDVPPPPAKRQRLLFMDEEFSKDTWSSLELFAADLEEDPIAFLPTPAASQQQQQPAGNDEEYTIAHHSIILTEEEGASIQRMIYILGNELMNQVSNLSSTTANNNNSQIMSLRLLLLTRPSRRSPEDNEVIQILARSADAHSNHHGRSESEIANLLVKEFAMLKMSMSMPAATTTTSSLTMMMPPSPPMAALGMVGPPPGLLVSSPPTTALKNPAVNVL